MAQVGLIANTLAVPQYRFLIHDTMMNFGVPQYNRPKCICKKLSLSLLSLFYLGERDFYPGMCPGCSALKPPLPVGRING